MATSAKRYGLESDDLETELRFRRIEAKLEELGGTGDFGQVTDDVKRVNTVPRVTGLRVKGSTPGAVTVAWAQVKVTDLRRYELDFAEDLAFTTNKQTFNVATTEWQFSTVSAIGGGGDTTIFARVRARTASGNVGQYSVTLDTATGQAQSEDIADEAVTDPKLDDSAVIQLALRGYKSGHVLSNNSTDDEHDIDISAGTSRNATNVMTIDSSTVIVKRIDAAYSAGTGNGGMSASIGLQADSEYYVFVVSNDDSSTVDAGFDDSLVAANLLSDSGLSFYRRIGVVLTDGSSNIKGFVQLGNTFTLNVPVQDILLQSPGTNEVTHTLASVPTGIVVLADATFVLSEADGSGSETYFLYGGGNTSLGVPSSTNADGVIVRSGSGNSLSIHDKVLTNTSAQVKTRQSNGGGSDFFHRITVHGWVDTLGMNGES